MQRWNLKQKKGPYEECVQNLRGQCFLGEGFFLQIKFLRKHWNTWRLLPLSEIAQGLWKAVALFNAACWGSSYVSSQAEGKKWRWMGSCGGGCYFWRGIQYGRYLYNDFLNVFRSKQQKFPHFLSFIPFLNMECEIRMTETLTFCGLSSWRSWCCNKMASNHLHPDESSIEARILPHHRIAHRNYIRLRYHCSSDKVNAREWTSNQEHNTKRRPTTSHNQT